MNKEIAKKRYMDVIRPDVMHNSQGDFLATHVPMKKLYITDHLTEHANVPEQDKKHPKTEEEVYSEYMMESKDDQFVLVIGDSGAGKSHLIRWINTVHDIRKSDNEIVLPIRRADNTLKGTIRQLIELPEVKNLPNKELYKKLASASTTVPELELKDTLYYSFVIQIENDDGKAGDAEGDRRISNVERKHLVALLQNSLFKDRLMADGGPIDRIYSKFAENKTNDINDTVAEFRTEDFEIDSEFRNQLLLGADDKARKIADKLIDNIEFTNAIREYMNLFVEKVIQRCAGLEPGDLANVIKEIRQELYKQGKTLTILIEDITAASGVDDSLLDALLTDKIEYPEENLCRLNAIVGSTDGYYREKFKTNTKGRIRKFVYVPDDLFSGNEEGLIEFFAKYLNTISLEADIVQKWIDKDKASTEHYPVHDVTIGEGWGEYDYSGKKINLFPFTRNAIIFLYNKQDMNHRNPRALMREIIELYVKDALEHLSEYPVKRPSLDIEDTTLQNAIYNNTFDDATKIRLTHFMYVWGNGKLQSYTKDGIKYVAGIPTNVYEEIGLPIVDSKEVEYKEVKKEEEEAAGEQGQQGPEKPKAETPKENEQVAIALAEVDRWIEHKDYKLNIGATTKNVRALNDARKNINDYLYNTIDWVSEGVSLDAALKIKETGNKFFVAFERQTMKSDAVITLPASIESRKIIESFVRWSEVGGKSWNFPGSTDYLYRVQRWSESIKPQIIDSILHYDKKETNYFTYAAAAEFYRLILNGYCKNYQNATNFTPEILLGKNKDIQEENNHTKAWNDLMKMVNGSDGKEALNCVLQYFNLPQGNTSSSTNYEYDYVSFAKAVRKVINTGLLFSDDELQLDDPVKKRRIYSEHLKKILDRIDTVVSEEKTVIQDKLTLLANEIDLDDLDGAEDIEDIVKSIGGFYSQAQTSHVSVAVHYDISIINSCKKNASTILSSIKTAQQISSITDPVEALIRLSKDPMKGLLPFVNLVVTAASDIEKANTESDNRMKDIDDGGDSSSETRYAEETKAISECKEIISEVKEHYVVG